MIHLLVASLLWAFSFGLIKRHLGGVDASLVAAIRLLLSALVFLPFLRRKVSDRVSIPALMAIGALQYGVMYIAYIQSYRFLAGHEVALLTVLTPLHVTLIHDALERRLDPGAALAAVVAVVGAGVVIHAGAGWRGAVTGIVLVQVSNACFAAGQVLYRRLLARARAAGEEVADLALFGWLYLGAVVVAGATALVTVDFATVHLTRTQGLVLLYLGLVPSGLAFFLWNVGATRTRAGTLAAMNNLKIPLAVGVALLVFGERADPLRLALGGAIIAGAIGGHEWWAGRASARERR